MFTEILALAPVVCIVLARDALLFYSNLMSAERVVLSSRLRQSGP